MSLGLMAVYLAFITLLGDKFKPPSDQGLALFIYLVIVALWGFANFSLFVYILLHALSLKYRHKREIEIYEYNFKVPSLAQQFFFDLGINLYVSGVFLTFLQYVPFQIDAYISRVFNIKFVGFIIGLLLAILPFAIADYYLNIRKENQNK